MSKFKRYKKQHPGALKTDPDFKIGQTVILNGILTGRIIAVHPGSIRVLSLAGVHNYPKAVISRVKE